MAPEARWSVPDLEEEQATIFHKIVDDRTDETSAKKVHNKEDELYEQMLRDTKKNTQEESSDTNIDESTEMQM
jgi:hypothetical protein